MCEKSFNRTIVELKQIYFTDLTDIKMVLIEPLWN